ncbi:hypothetical protein NOR53_1211 [gamma proteobacterium NOR5-3]|nr:hypothetical protein NOR53_1211 [gamma proteobacterium NOR5-3]
MHLIDASFKRGLASILDPKVPQELCVDIGLRLRNYAQTDKHQ